MLYFSLVYFAEMGRGLWLGCATVGGFASVLHFLWGFLGGEGGVVFFSMIFLLGIFFFLFSFFFFFSKVWGELDILGAYSASLLSKSRYFYVAYTLCGNCCATSYHSFVLNLVVTMSILNMEVKLYLWYVYIYIYTYTHTAWWHFCAGNYFLLY